MLHLLTKFVSLFISCSIFFRYPVYLESTNRIYIAQDKNDAGQELLGEDAHRIYSFFPHIRVVEGVTWVKGHFYSSDGGVYECEGSFSSSVGLSEATFSQRLMYFDVPNYVEMCYFELGPVGYSSPWSTTPFMKISGICYVFDIIDYGHLENNSGWHVPSISMKEFADCILSQLNENSDSSVNGFNAYPYLSESFYKNISDFNYELATQIAWTDIFSGEQTDFITKWNTVKNKFDIEGKKVSISWFHWEYVVGTMTLSFAVFLLVRYFHKARKKDEIN